MSNSYSICFTLVLVFLVQIPPPTYCHTKGLRPGRHNSGPGLSINRTQIQNSELQFMKWINFVGSLKHSVFKTAKNKLFPSYTLHVSKNPAIADFETIQEAIDSLPNINLVRVIIKVHAGVYT